jgi:hypothetical protein
MHNASQRSGASKIRTTRLAGSQIPLGQSNLSNGAIEESKKRYGNFDIAWGGRSSRAAWQG